MAPTRSSDRSLIAYFIYGARPEYQAEAAFSIATARQTLGDDARDVDIVVVTDQLEFARPIDARRILVSAEEFAAWTGQRRNHRAKLCALARVLREDARAVALVDTDTYFVKSPRLIFERVNAAQSVMHASEGALGDDSEWIPVLRDAASVARLNASGCTRDSTMFNSGVIALATERRELAADALRWFDGEADHIHPFSLEQVAVSVALQRGTRVVPCDDVLVHYWGHSRPFVHVQIEAALRVGSARTDALGIPSVSVRDRVQSRGLAALLGWSAECRFAYQASLAARSSSQRTDGYALAWAETAIFALERARDVHALQPGRVPALKRSLAPLGTAAWIPAQLRARWDKLW